MLSALVFIVPVALFLFYSVMEMVAPPAVVRTSEGYEVIA